MDIGSNGPGIANYIKDNKNIELTNVDIKKFSPKDIKNFPEVNFVTYDGKKLPFKDNHFDVSVSMGTFEHVPRDNRENFFKEIVRVTKDLIVMDFPLSTSSKVDKLVKVIFFNKIVFLNEHEEYGLPTNAEFLELIASDSRLKLLKTHENINVYLWVPLKIFSSGVYYFVKHKPRLVMKLFKFHKNFLHKFINLGTGYTRVFVISKKNG
jgi:hypothetical protein